MAFVTELILVGMTLHTGILKTHGILLSITCCKNRIAVAHDPVVALGVLELLLVLDPYVAADAGVEIDDRVLDQASVADPHRGRAWWSFGRILFRPHDQRAPHRGLGDLRADADHRLFNGGVADDRPAGQNRLIEAAAAEP